MTLFDGSAEESRKRHREVKNSFDTSSPSSWIFHGAEHVASRCWQQVIAPSVPHETITRPPSLWRAPFCVQFARHRKSPRLPARWCSPAEHKNAKVVYLNPNCRNLISFRQVKNGFRQRTPQSSLRKQLQQTRHTISISIRIWQLFHI